MGLSLYLIALGGLMASLGSGQVVNFRNTVIDSGVGLYYEPMHQIRFTKTEWKLVIYVDLESFEAEKPIVSRKEVTDAVEMCSRFPHTVNCDLVMNKWHMKAKMEEIDKYLHHLRSLSNSHNFTFDKEGEIFKRDVPFGSIASVSKMLSGALSTNDASYYNTEIDKKKG